jgi:aspartate racemase
MGKSLETPPQAMGANDKIGNWEAITSRRELHGEGEPEMKTIGLLGGMSWESTKTYYQLINESVKARLRGLHSAKIAMVSVDFHEIEQLQHAGDWRGTASILIDAAQKVEAAGADFLLICTNTMHKVAPEVEQAIRIPLLHIADATAQHARDAGIETVGLLGTNFTMEQSFYKGRMADKYNLNVLIPGKKDRDLIHRVIYDELCLGKIEAASRKGYLRIMQTLADRGAEAIILGCTEIGSLVRPEHTDIPLFDTTVIHAEAAVAEALQ